MVHKFIYDVFRAGSKTYFYSSLFFPPRVREDVFVLYGFVRCADDLVDSVPQKKEEFYSFREKYLQASSGEKTGDIIVDSFWALAQKKEFEPGWIKAFLDSMESDLHWRGSKSMDKIEEYIYGSAEVVGLMMAKILGLPLDAHPYARLLGKSMQYLNFIRDISEDLGFGRNYFPKDDFTWYGINSLEYCSVSEKPEEFIQFIHKQLSYYGIWQKEAEKGFEYIPKRYLIPIKTASDMYKWTGERIFKDPWVVYSRKVKPSVPRIVSTIAHTALTL